MHIQHLAFLTLITRLKIDSRGALPSRWPVEGHRGRPDDRLRSGHERMRDPRPRARGRACLRLGRCAAEGGCGRRGRRGDVPHDGGDEDEEHGLGRPGGARDV